MTSPFNWRAPSTLGNELQRYSNARNGSTKGVDTRRRNGQDTSTFRGMSKRADQLIAQKQGKEV